MISRRMLSRKNDSIDNYDEVDCPEEHKGDMDYDNTVKF